MGQYDNIVGCSQRAKSAHADGHNKVTSVAFSPDGKLLASGSWDSTIILWDVASGQEVRTLETLQHGKQCGLLAGWKLLVPGLISGTVKLWDVASGRKCAR